MGRKKHNHGAAARDRPAKNAQERGVVWSGSGNTITTLLGDIGIADTLACPGYTTLSQSPEVVTAVDRIAELMGAMPIHVYRNGERADFRVDNDIARIVDIEPNRYQTRANWMKWIVRTMYLDGDGNSCVLPVTTGGTLRELQPVPALYCAYYPTGLWGYRVEINGRSYDPETVLHFIKEPGGLYPWLGVGPRVIVREVANNLKQAEATEKGFMESKWKPSVIIKVDAFNEKFSTPDGRKELLDEYITNSEEGQPWVIPAEQFDVQSIKPLTLSDLALSDFVELDKRTVASILGVPPFVLGVGDFNRQQWNNFINTVLMPLAQNIAQELTKKLLPDTDLYFRFNPRALLDYDLRELIAAGVQMVDRMAMRRNELRDWAGLPFDEDMDELLALENYIPADRLGDQAKLTEGGGSNDA